MISRNGIAVINENECIKPIEGITFTEIVMESVTTRHVLNSYVVVVYGDNMIVFIKNRYGRMNEIPTDIQNKISMYIKMNEELIK